MATAADYSGKLISAASIASPFQADIIDAIKRRKVKGKAVPKLIGILATPSPPSVAYAEWTKKACEQVGIKFEIWKTWCEQSIGDGQADAMEGVDTQRPDTDLEADVEDLIIAANADDDIHGIMVYYPIFGGRQDTYLQQILDPRKDVEGLHFSYCWNMYHNVRWILPHQLGGAPGTTTEANGQVTGQEVDERIPAGFAKSILPCTPLAVVKCLESMDVYDRHLPYGDRLYGKVITVINRSEVVGRPLAALLSNDGAKVFSIDLDSVQEFNKRATIEKDRRPSEAVTRARERNSQRKLRSHHIVRPSPMTMQQCIEASDVVISGVPSSNFKIQTDWIKSGAITVNFSSEKNFEKDVRTRAAKHLPAIGKTTIAMLQRNLLRLVEYKEMGAANHSNSNGNEGGGGGGYDDSDHGGDGGRRQGGVDDNGDSQRSNGSSKFPSSQVNTSIPATEPTRDGGKETNRMLRCAADDSALFLPPVKTNRCGLGPAFAYRNRANTVTLPPTLPVDQSNVRTISHPATLQHGEWTYPYHRGSIASTSTAATSTSWDWRRGDDSRRDSLVSNITTVASRDTPSPSNVKTKMEAITLPSLSQSSPLIFAPASPFGTNGSTSSSRGSVYTTNPLSLLEKASSMSSPRSATSISPLMIDQLSVDDSIYPQILQYHDSNMPRTPRDGHQVLDRPMKDMPQRLYQPFAFPSEAEKGTDSSLSLHRDSNTSDAPNRINQNRRRRRPPFSYSSLIAQAISSSSEGRMTLREIYTWISKAYPDLYSMDGNEGSGWQNTVRHNLSLNKCFVKVARTAKDIYESCSSGLPSQSQAARGKGGWWTLDHSVAQAQLGNFFRRDSLGSDGSNGMNTPVSASFNSAHSDEVRGRVMDGISHSPTSISMPSPSVLQSVPCYSPRQPRQYHQASPTAVNYGSYDSNQHLPLNHPARKMSMSEANESRHMLPLVSARRSSVSSNQHSTIKRKLPFATPCHRQGNGSGGVEHYFSHQQSSSGLMPLSLQRPQMQSSPSHQHSSYQQKNQRQELQDTHRINSPLHYDSTLKSRVPSVSTLSSSQRSTAMQVDDLSTSSNTTAKIESSDSMKNSGRLAINELLNS